MMLTWIALGMLFWLGLRCVLPLPVGLPTKAAIMALGLFVSLKYTIYTRLGGAFFAPDLPRPVLVLFEVAFVCLILLFVLVMFKDLLLLLLWLARRLGTGKAWAWPLSSPRTHGLLLALALALSVFGVWQGTKVPDVRTVELVLPRLPKALDGFSLVQLSDLHVSPFQGRDWLAAVVAKVNALNPDAVALTGDLIDGLPARSAPEIAPLADLHPPMASLPSPATTNTILAAKPGFRCWNGSASRC